MEHYAPIFDLLKVFTVMDSHKKSSPFQRSIAYLSLLLLGAGGAIAGERLIGPKEGSVAQLVAQPSLTAPAVGGGATSRILTGGGDRNFIASAVQKVGPAVVRIDAQRSVSAEFDPFMRRFGGPNMPRERVQEGVGSGFILDANGLIMTNAHVVDGADEVTVTLKDGRSYSGRVLGEDRVTDVAVVKIEATNLPTVPLGNSDQLQPGEWAIAIGNPLGLDNTVTAGIISATGRSSSQVGIPDQRVSFIQTDAAINPGNSGGPLLNEQGEVIGVNTAIRANAQGLGFAIPMNTAKRIADDLITKGRVDHPFLGVRMVTLTPQLKENINNDPESGVTVQEEEGVLIMGVAERSPADRGGLRPGDVITKIGQDSITQSEQVQQIVENSSIGSELQIEIRRNGQPLTLTVRPGTFPNEPQG